jgi:hypothetical protein
VPQNEFTLISFYDHCITASGRPEPAHDRRRIRPGGGVEFGIRDLPEDIPIEQDRAGGRLLNVCVPSGPSLAKIYKKRYFAEYRRISLLFSGFS